MKMDYQTACQVARVLAEACVSKQPSLIIIKAILNFTERSLEKVEIGGRCFFPTTDEHSTKEAQATYRALMWVQDVIDMLAARQAELGGDSSLSPKEKKCRDNLKRWHGVINLLHYIQLESCPRYQNELQHTYDRFARINNCIGGYVPPSEGDTYGTEHGGYTFPT